MVNIGLTGGIGAGKSTVSRTLADLGAVIIDADLIARQVVEPGTPGLAAIVGQFGKSVLSPDGSLDRAALAAIAFGDEQSRLALNGIVHPLVGRRRQELIDDAPADAIVVQDIPLLVETGAAPWFDLVIVVHVEVEERVRRLVEIRGITEADARSRITAQATDEARRAAADVWLDNSGTESQLAQSVRALWTHRLVPFAENTRAGLPARVVPRLVDPDPRWPDSARRLIARLAAACGDRATRIDHIGSTAVLGLPAEDVLDIQITVADLSAADALAEPLGAVGFPRIEHITDDDPRPQYGVPGEADPTLWRKRFHASADPGRPTNVHIRVQGWPGQRFALAFRDWLRAEPDRAQEYLAVKRRAAEAAAGIDDIDEAIAAYSAVKGPWLDASQQAVWEWVEATEWVDSVGWSAAENP